MAMWVWWVLVLVSTAIGMGSAMSYSSPPPRRPNVSRPARKVAPAQVPLAALGSATVRTPTTPAGSCASRCG